MNSCGARAALNADTGVILLLEADGQRLMPVASDGFDHDLPAIPVPLGSGVAGHIALSEDGVIIEDLQAVELVLASLRDQIPSLVGASLRARGRLIGVIHVGSITFRQFTDDDLAFLRMVAERAAAESAGATTS